MNEMGNKKLFCEQSNGRGCYEQLEQMCFIFPHEQKKGIRKILLAQIDGVARTMEMQKYSRFGSIHKEEVNPHNRTRAHDRAREEWNKNVLGLLPFNCKRICKWYIS